MDKARKTAVKEEGWRRAIIKTSLGLNRSGVFRPAISVLREQLDRNGGLESIIPFSTNLRQGERVFSAPWDFNVLKQYEATDTSDKTIMIDSYADGHILSSSGTQSSSNMRVRFSNVKGASQDWEDVGIEPILHATNANISDRPLRYEKHIVHHRFTYLIYKELIHSSHVGYLYKGSRIYPRVGMLVADQPQERTELSLKDHGSFCDCSLCTMPTSIRKKSLLGTTWIWVLPL